VRLYLLRHGETDWNVDRRLQGLIDTPLNSKGVQQAQGWRSYFDRIRLSAIYSSSLQRAIDTAVLATGRPACIIDGFNERGFGAWEGSTWQELQQTVSEFDERWNEDSFCPPGGESRHALYSRVESALDEIVFEHDKTDEVLIVAHGASGHAIMGTLLDRPISDRSSLPVLHNASLTILEFRKPVWDIVEQLPALFLA
jgi:broad specificity phosphatase PhoE